MDWSAVALLLAERAELPVVLLSEEGEVLHVAPAAQKALGCPGDCAGKNWIELSGSAEEAAQARGILAKALTGATHRVDVNLPTAHGPSIATFESYPIGHGMSRGILLFLQKITPAALDSTASDFDYDVEKTPAGDYELRSLQRWGKPPTPAEGPCFRVLHGRANPCEHCPIAALRRVGDVHASARRCGDRDVEVSTARLLGEDQVHVSVRHLSSTAFSAMLRARLEALAERARLSERERDVLGLLVDGRGFEEIGNALGITPRTVKYHQAKLLSKLGADSRSDLMRLLF